MSSAESSIQRAKNNITVSKAKLAAMAIAEDISDRRGIKHEWNSIDEETQLEIFDTWAEIIKTVYES